MLMRWFSPIRKFSGWTRRGHLLVRCAKPSLAQPKSKWGGGDGWDNPSQESECLWKQSGGSVLSYLCWLKATVYLPRYTEFERVVG